MLVNEFLQQKILTCPTVLFQVWLCSVIRVFLVLCDRLHPPSFDRLSLACSHTPPAWGWDTSTCKAPDCKPWLEPSCIFSSTHSPLRPSYTSLSSLWNPQWGRSQPDVGCFFLHIVIMMNNTLQEGESEGWTDSQTAFNLGKHIRTITNKFPASKTKATERDDVNDLSTVYPWFFHTIR